VGLSVSAIDHRELAEKLAMLRNHGVAKFHETPDGIAVEFFPAYAAPEKPKPTNDPETCPCKHHLHIAHVNGLCVEGCDPAQCNPEQK
jgi:hypothetical protein